MTDDAHAAIVAALSSPESYPHRPVRVEIKQTHISWVFLAGDEVFKVKKPVRFSFLDFSTRARRRQACLDEVRLNRRLAADVYLGVLGVRLAPDGPVWSATAAEDMGEPVVHMRRLADERMLPRLLVDGLAGPAEIDAIVARLVRFHAEADRSAEVRALSDPDRMQVFLANDFAEVERFRGTVLDPEDDDEVRAFLDVGLESRKPQLRRRVAQGRACEGHGDLHADHVCIRPNGEVLIFDCIEFSRELRCRDVAAEVSFLKMDLEFRGYPELAEHLVRGYADATQDAEFSGLTEWFACQRAYVRTKVDCLRSESPDVGEAMRVAARSEARRHLDLALRYARTTRPLVVVVHGISGSGKSTIARRIAARTGFVRLASDEIRKEIAGLAWTDRSGAGGWLYTSEMSGRTYGTLYERAAATLARGQGVLLDATFQRRIDRRVARKVADDAGAELLLVECTCPEEEIERRLEERRVHNADASDADIGVARAQREVYEPWDEAEEQEGVRVDTRDIVPALHAIERRLQDLGVITPRR